MNIVSLLFIACTLSMPADAVHKQQHRGHEQTYPRHTTSLEFENNNWLPTLDITVVLQYIVLAALSWALTSSIFFRLLKHPDHAMYPRSPRAIHRASIKRKQEATARQTAVHALEFHQDSAKSPTKQQNKGKHAGAHKEQNRNGHNSNVQHPKTAPTNSKAKSSKQQTPTVLTASKQTSTKQNTKTVSHQSSSSLKEKKAQKAIPTKANAAKPHSPQQTENRPATVSKPTSTQQHAKTAPPSSQPKSPQHIVQNTAVSLKLAPSPKQANAVVTPRLTPSQSNINRGSPQQNLKPSTPHTAMVRNDRPAVQPNINIKPPQHQLQSKPSTQPIVSRAAVSNNTTTTPSQHSISSGRQTTAVHTVKSPTKQMPLNHPTFAPKPSLSPSLQSSVKSPKKKAKQAFQDPLSDPQIRNLVSSFLSGTRSATPAHLSPAAQRTGSQPQVNSPTSFQQLLNVKRAISSDHKSKSPTVQFASEPFSRSMPSSPLNPYAKPFVSSFTRDKMIERPWMGPKIGFPLNSLPFQSPKTIITTGSPLGWKRTPSTFTTSSLASPAKSASSPAKAASPKSPTTLMPSHLNPNSPVFVSSRF